MNTKKRLVIGFTIVEVMVVIFVIGILASITYISYNGIQKKVIDVSLDSDVQRIAALETSYKANHGVVGVAYYSGNGTGSVLGFTPKSGNVIDVVFNSVGYCVRGYNVKGTENSIYSPSTKESSPGVCSQLDPSVSAVGDYYGGSRSYGIAAGDVLAYMSQSDLNQYVVSLQDLGVKWVRWDIEWGLVQPNNSTTFDWTAVDRVANTLKSHNLNSLGIILAVPQWARQSACSTIWECSPSDPQTYGTFAGQVAARYKDSITNFEIWNEPNTNWLPAPNATQYGNVLHAAYTAIKNGNPSAKVVGGSLSPASDDGTNIAPLTFLQSLYSSNNNQYFDYLGVHPSSFPMSPNYVASWNAWQQMYTAHQYMIDHGDSAKKVWITEYCSPTKGTGLSFEVNQSGTYNWGTDYMSEAAQSQLMTSAIDSYVQNSSWIGNFFYYSLIDKGTVLSDQENFYGLIRFDGTKKPSYDVFKSAVKQDS